MKSAFGFFTLGTIRSLACVSAVRLAGSALRPCLFDGAGLAEDEGGIAKAVGSALIIFSSLIAIASRHQDPAKIGQRAFSLSN